MSVAILIAITLMGIAWSLWIRRVTWTCRWEVAATLNIALQGLAVLLMSPLASETIGQTLYRLTGKWNLEDYIGHDCYIVAASAVVYNALGRLQDDNAMQRSFKQYVERPATVCIPLLLAAFSLGNGAAESALLWCAGDASAATRSPLTPDRQHLPVRVGERNSRVCRPPRHRIRPGATTDRERSASY